MTNAPTTPTGWPSLPDAQLCGGYLKLRERHFRTTGPIESAVRADSDEPPLGAVYWRQGHYQQATDHLQPALAMCREIGDRTGEARALALLGIVCWLQCRYDQAADHY